MKVPVHQSIAGLCIVVACVMAAPSVASAQDDAFKRGLAARDRKEWAEVAAAMREAIRADARESSTRKVRTGFLGRTSTEYLPHFFLGEALKNTNDCAGAVSEWEASEDQREVQKVQNLYTELQAGAKECASRGVLLRNEFRQQVSSTDAAYNEASELLGRVANAKTSNAELWRPEFDGDLDRARNELGAAQGRLVKARATRLAADFTESRNGSARAGGMLRPIEERLGAALTARMQIQQQAADVRQRLASAETSDREIEATKIVLEPSLAASRDSGRALIGRARDRLGVAEKTQNASASSEAAQLAQEASDTLAKVLEQIAKIARSELAQRLQQLVATATQELSFLQSQFDTLDRLAAQKPDKVPQNLIAERAQLQKEQTALQRRFDNARRTENFTGVEDVTRQIADARTRIDALITRFGPATLRDRGVHPSLEQGARYYMANEYRQALAALEPANGLSEAPLQGHVHLFRAASLYALYAHSGEKDQKLRDDAIAEIRLCKEADPLLQPSPRAFSPSFIAFFQMGGTSNAQPAPAGSQP